MGSIYSRRIMGIKSPTVRILSNGEEQGKGSQLVLDASTLLESTPGITFLGNIEGRDIVNDLADVVVTDGFTGNVLIETAEGVGKLIRTILVEEITASPVSKLGGRAGKVCPAPPGQAGGRQRVWRGRAARSLQFGGGGPRAQQRHVVRHAIRVAKQAIDFKIVDEIQAGVRYIERIAVGTSYANCLGSITRQNSKNLSARMTQHSTALVNCERFCAFSTAFWQAPNRTTKPKP